MLDLVVNYITLGCLSTSKFETFDSMGNISNQTFYRVLNCSLSIIHVM